MATSKSNKHQWLAIRTPSATRCNLSMQHTRITHSQSDHTLAGTSELEGSQALSSMDTKSPKVLNLSHGRDTHLIIAQRPNIAVSFFCALTGRTCAETRRVWSHASGRSNTVTCHNRLKIAVAAQGSLRACMPPTDWTHRSHDRTHQATSSGRIH